MNKIIVSINPMAEFLEATETRREKIIKEQLDPDPVRVPYYQLARARMTKSILQNGSLTVIEDAQLVLRSRKPEKDTWRFYDKDNSILALERYKKLNLPDVISNGRIQKVMTKAKYLPIYGVNIKVSPNLIFRTVIDGQKTIGAIKLHVSKGKPFNRRQSALVAQLLNQFLSNFVVEEDEVVDPQLCICIDPFAGTTISAFNKINLDMKELKMICSEILPAIWDKERIDRGDNVA